MAASPHLQFKSVRYTGLADGPRLIVTGAVHGNEICGTRAIERVLRELDDGALRIVAGSLTLVPVCNPLAYARGQRGGDRNLNRSLFPTPRPADFEDRVANWLCPLLAQHDVLLDLHSFSAVGAPFVMMGPRDNDGPLQPFRHEREERALARRLGVQRFVEGWLQTYAQGVRRRLQGSAQLETTLRYGVGTTEYMRSTGGYALTLECGQHDDPQAPEVAYRAIRNTLAHLGLCGAPDPAPVEQAGMEALRMEEVHDRLQEGDVFSRPWSSFDRVRSGEPIGRRADGTPVLAPWDGVILFPAADAELNTEWYYLARTYPASEV
jgi:predicted deacylase